MNCSNCGSPMREETYEGVQLDLCGRCKGAWLDGAELLDVLDRREKTFPPSLRDHVMTREKSKPAAPPSEEARRLACPRCSKELQVVRYEYSTEVVVDRCPAGCGLFLDGGELDHLQILLEHTEHEVHEYCEKTPFQKPSVEVQRDIDAFAKRLSLWRVAARKIGLLRG